jgi:hypothetical protein
LRADYDTVPTADAIVFMVKRAKMGNHRTTMKRLIWHELARVRVLGPVRQFRGRAATTDWDLFEALSKQERPKLVARALRHFYHAEVLRAKHEWYVGLDREFTVLGYNTAHSRKSDSIPVYLTNKLPPKGFPDPVRVEYVGKSRPSIFGWVSYNQPAGWVTVEWEDGTAGMASDDDLKFYWGHHESRPIFERPA